MTEPKESGFKLGIFRKAKGGSTLLKTEELIEILNNDRRAPLTYILINFKNLETARLKATRDKTGELIYFFLGIIEDVILC